MRELGNVKNIREGRSVGVEPTSSPTNFSAALPLSYQMANLQQPISLHRVISLYPSIIRMVLFAKRMTIVFRHPLLLQYSNSASLQQVLEAHLVFRQIRSHGVSSAGKDLVALVNTVHFRDVGS